MKNLIISGTGYPGTNKTLRFIRDANNENMQGVALTAGHLAILDGVEVVGTAVSAGWISWNKQLIEFEAGTLGTDVTIIETIENGNYNNDSGNPADLSALPAYVTRKARFGTGGIDTFEFSELRRIKDLRELAVLPSSVLEFHGRGQIAIGEIQSNGEIINIVFPTAVATANYMVLGEFTSEFTSGETFGISTGVAWEVRSKTVNGFELRCRRIAANPTALNSYKFNYTLI